MAVGVKMERGVIRVTNSKEPIASDRNSFKLFSKNINGNAAPHFITEAGKTIKLYQQAAISDPSGGATVDTEARAAIDAILDVLQNNGLIST